MGSSFVTNAYRTNLDATNGADLLLIAVDATQTPTRAMRYASEITAEVTGPDYLRGEATGVVFEQSATSVADYTTDPVLQLNDVDTVAGIWTCLVPAGWDTLDTSLELVAYNAVGVGAGFADWPVQRANGYARVTNDTTGGAGTGIVVSPRAPTSASTGDLWLRTDANVQASQDWRVYDDGTPAGISDPTDTPPWTPFTTGPGTLGAIPVLDASLAGAPFEALTVTNGCLRAADGTGTYTGIQAVYNIGSPTTDTFQSIVGFADWLNDDDSDPAGAGINIIIVDPAGTGPIAHCAVDTNVGEQVAEFKIGLDNGGTAYIGAVTHHLDRLPGAGDRMALVVDTVARSWELHFNGELVPGMVCTLVDDGVGGEDVVVGADPLTGETVTNLATPYDFSAIYATGGPISCSDATNAYQGGVAWWALAESDYAPELVTLCEFDGTDWVKRIEPDRPRPDYPARITALAPGGGSGSVATDAIFDAKGDLPVGAAANTAAKLTVGTNGQVLTADSAEPTGLKWATVAGTGDVVGPASAVDSHVALFDTTTGKLLKDGGALGDAAAKNTGTTAGTLAAGDDSRITGAAQKASNLSDLASTATALTNLGAQPVDSDLTAIAGLSPSNDDIIQRKAGVWTKRTMAQLMADVMPLMFGSSSLSVFTAPSASVGTYAPTAGSNAVYLISSSSAVNDYIEWSNFPLPAGTFTVSLTHMTGTGNGQLRISIDGTNIGGGVIESYAASTAAAREVITGVSIASSGLHTVRITTPSKNASSSAYVMRLVDLAFARTA